jgi:hypothetical protein
VRIADAEGNTMMRGDFEAAAFMDIWDRATKQGAGGDTDAVYQSILSNLHWGDVAFSPFLVAPVGVYTQAPTLPHSASFGRRAHRAIGLMMSLEGQARISTDHPFDHVTKRLSRC